MGLGFKSISIDPHSIIPIAHALKGLDAALCKETAGKCLRARTGAAVKDILKHTSGIPYETRKEVSTGYLNEVKDSVCEMTVKKETAQFTAEYDNEKYYFCSKRCRKKFLESLQGDMMMSKNLYLSKEGISTDEKNIEV